LQWGLNKKIGDTIEYIDANGEPFKIEFVGSLKSSLLQGSVFIEEEAFVTKFPAVEGYRILLVDAPFDRREEIAAHLERAGRNIGLEITLSEERLARYYQVEKTYLSIFLLLGGLGLILGCIGLATILLRNVLERRNELALLQAVGMTRHDLGRMLIIEHAGLLILGMVCGSVAALIAVIPALQSLGTDLPLGTLSLILLAIFANGLLWIWLASRFATRGTFLDALRNE
jgi:ABC-type antimicrobial peptide transport system permease subunit